MRLVADGGRASMSARSTEKIDGWRLRSSSVKRPAGARTVPVDGVVGGREPLDGGERAERARRRAAAARARARSAPRRGSRGRAPPARAADRRSPCPSACSGPGTRSWKRAARRDACRARRRWARWRWRWGCRRRSGRIRMPPRVSYWSVRHGLASSERGADPGAATKTRKPPPSGRLPDLSALRSRARSGRTALSGTATTSTRASERIGFTARDPAGIGERCQAIAESSTGPGHQRGYTDTHGLDYPWTEPPASGTAIEVAPGVAWLRMPLPFQLESHQSVAGRGRPGLGHRRHRRGPARRPRPVGAGLRRLPEWPSGDAGDRHALSSRPHGQHRMADPALRCRSVVRAGRISHQPGGAPHGRARRAPSAYGALPAKRLHRGAVDRAGRARRSLHPTGARRFRRRSGWWPTATR